MKKEEYIKRLEELYKIATDPNTPTRPDIDMALEILERIRKAD